MFLCMYEVCENSKQRGEYLWMQVIIKSRLHLDVFSVCIPMFLYMNITLTEMFSKSCTHTYTHTHAAWKEASSFALHTAVMTSSNFYWDVRSSQKMAAPRVFSVASLHAVACDGHVRLFLNKYLWLSWKGVLVACDMTKKVAFSNNTTSSAPQACRHTPKKLERYPGGLFPHYSGTEKTKGGKQRLRQECN